MPNERRRRRPPQQGGNDDMRGMLQLLYYLEYSDRTRRRQRRSISHWVVMFTILLAGLLIFVSVDAYGYDGTIGKVRGGIGWIGEKLGLVEPASVRLPGGLLRDIPLQTPPTLTAARIDEVLSAAGSPAAGSGAKFYSEGVERGINPAIPLGFFRNENGYMTNPGAADKGNGETTKNLGNIICAGYPTCFNGFRDYASWDDAIEDWFRLIDEEYIQGRGHKTIHDVTVVYVPFGHGNNNPDAYADNVGELVVCWSDPEIPVRDCEVKATHNGSGEPPTFDGITVGVSGDADTGGEVTQDEKPQGNPLNDARTVLNQGYGVGSHSPAESMGGIDLAIDGDGDGASEPATTDNAPVYATHDGTIELFANSWPGGNFIKLRNNAYRTSYGHLSSFAVESGQFVRKGTVIGYVGTTGQSSGPHLHYEVWEIVNGTEVNRNPLVYDALSDQQRVVSQPNDNQAGFDTKKLKETVTELKDDFVAWAQRQRERIQNGIGAEPGDVTVAGEDYNFELIVTDGLYASEAERAQLQLLSAQAMAYVQKRFGAKLADSVRLNYTENTDCDLLGFAYTWDTRDLQVFTCNGIPMEAAISIMAHEIVHMLQTDHYGKDAMMTDDLMLVEGSATWGAGSYWMGGTEDARSYGRTWREKYREATGTYLPLTESVYGQSAFVMNAGYYQWASFVDFLITTYGRDKFDRVYVTGTGAPGSANYGLVYGKSLAELEAEWQEWLYK